MSTHGETHDDGDTHDPEQPEVKGAWEAVRHPRKDLGTTRGYWWIAMMVIVAVVVAAMVVLVLVANDTLDRGWAYVVLPFAIIAAAASRVLTIFKASAEDRRG